MSPPDDVAKAHPSAGTLSHEDVSLTREQRRSRRVHPVRKQTVQLMRLTKREAEERRAEFPDIDHPRPLTRGDCESVERPCPYVGCIHHLYLDVTRNGNLILNFPDREPDELAETCVLDVAESGAQSLEHAGELMNLTPERVRQLEGRAMRRMSEGNERFQSVVEDERRDPRRTLLNEDCRISRDDEEGGGE